MTSLKLTLVLPAVFLIFSCKVISKTNAQKSATIRNIILKEEVSENLYDDPYKIVSAEVNKDILSIVVNFSGGCKNHEWLLTGTKNFKKSLPPKKGLTLEHNSNDDNCRKLITDTLYFDLETIKYPGKESNYTVILELTKFNKIISYQY